LSDNIWSPIFDSTLYKGDKTETYWPMGCTDTEFLAVICRGTTVPTHPKPIINDLPLQIPFCGDSEKVKLEEKSSRGRLVLTQLRNSDQVLEITRRENELDKVALQLIMVACKSEQIQRVLDLANQVFSIKTLDGAIKVASYNKMITLAERLTQMKEVLVDLM
jgi:chromosome transmission fidelity protein 4